jgi:hypothetical protein
VEENESESESGNEESNLFSSSAAATADNGRNVQSKADKGANRRMKHNRRSHLLIKQVFVFFKNNN